MGLLDVLLFLVIGVIAGALAGKIMRGGGFGLVGNLVVGVVGAALGGFLFRLAGVETVGLIGALVTALVGAVVLLYVVGLLKKA